MSEGHELARRQIAKHGKDRYPTKGAQFAKILDELGELGTELIDLGRLELIRREYADVGLALHELGNKLGIDLIECMREVVDTDERTFA